MKYLNTLIGFRTIRDSKMMFLNTHLVKSNVESLKNRGEITALGD